VLPGNINILKILRTILDRECLHSMPAPVACFLRGLLRNSWFRRRVRSAVLVPLHVPTSCRMRFLMFRQVSPTVCMRFNM
jgi:hypothetical protein